MKTDAKNQNNRQAVGRRKFIKGAIAAGGAAGLVASGNLGFNIRTAKAATKTWKIQTSWPGGIGLKIFKDWCNGIADKTGGELAFKPFGAKDVVGDFQLFGWLWGENMGWISLSCLNTSSCGTVSYGVTNDGAGNLSGFAWAENAGWVNFAPSTSAAAIDPNTGEFSGYVWSENLGWVSLSCTNTGTGGTVDYGIKTGWSRSVVAASHAQRANHVWPVRGGQ